MKFKRQISILSLHFGFKKFRVWQNFSSNLPLDNIQWILPDKKIVEIAKIGHSIQRAIPTLLPFSMVFSILNLSRNCNLHPICLKWLVICKLHNVTCIKTLQDFHMWSVAVCRYLAICSLHIVFGAHHSGWELLYALFDCWNTTIRSQKEFFCRRSLKSSQSISSVKGTDYQFVFTEHCPLYFGCKSPPVTWRKISVDLLGRHSYWRSLVPRFSS